MHPIVVISDVFGKTSGLISLAQALNAQAIIDPYQNKMMNFANEEQAYQHFIEHVGLDNYTRLLMQQVSELKQSTTLLGFSVGASALWRLSQNSLPQVKHAICYYGSQIKNFDTLEPHIKTHVVFPKCEPHFDVNLLKDKLVVKDNVKIIETEYLHGFMNKHSTNFNEFAYQEQIKKLQSGSLIN